MRVLLIEPDTATAQSIELMLKSEYFNVYTTDLGEEGVQLGQLYDYDVILLELKLPDMSGFDVIKQLRVGKVKSSIIVVSGGHDVDFTVKALGFGADDYITKPFYKDELVARIHAVVRRSRGHAESRIKFDDLEINLDSQTATFRGERIALTGKEWKMVQLMALRRGMTLSKEQFLNHLYGGLDEPEVKIIDVFICKLRKKLAAAALAAGVEGYSPIETVWGRGYVMREPNKQNRENATMGAADVDEMSHYNLINGISCAALQGETIKIERSKEI